MAMIPYTGEILPLDERERDLSLQEQEVTSKMRPLSTEEELRIRGEAVLDADPSVPNDTSNDFEEGLQRIQGHEDFLNERAAREEAAREQHNKETLDHLGATRGGGFPGSFSTIPDSMLDIPVKIGKGIIKGIPNAATEALKIGSATRDLLTGSDDTKYFDQAFPTIPTEPGLESAAETVTRTGIGAVAGGKGADLLTRAAVRPATSTLGRIGQYGGKFIGQNAGAAMTETADPLFMEMAGVNPDDSSAEVLFKHKLQLAEESLILGAAFGTVGTVSSKILAPIISYVPRAMKNWNNLDANKKKFVRDLLATFSDVTPEMPREEVQRRMSSAMELVRNQRPETISFGDASVEDVIASQDTISNLINLLDSSNPNHARVKTVLEGLRSSAVAGKAPGLVAKLGKPEEQFREVIDKFHTTRGGAEGIEQGRESIVEGGLQEVAPAREAVREAERDVVAARRGIEGEIADNPAFKEITSKANPDQVKINTSQGADDLADTMTQNLNRADDLHTKEKNALWANIPEGVVVEPETLSKQIENAVQSGGLDKNLMKVLNDTGNDFKKLNHFSSTHLQNKIDSLFSTDIRHQNPELLKQAESLKNLRDYIQGDMIDDVIDSPEAIEAMENLTKAREFYHGTYAPKYRDAPLKDIQKNTRFMPEDEGFKTNRGIVESALSDRNSREYTDNILETLATDEGGRSAGLAVDYALHKVATRVQDAFNKSGGKLTPEEINSLAGEFDKFIPIFKKQAPEKIGELEEFLTKVRNKNFSVKDAERILDMKKANAAVAEEEVLGRRLKPFFTKDNRGYTANQDGLEIFTRIMDHPEGGAKIDEILSSGDPLARKAMQAAWAKSAEHKLFDNKKNVGLLSDTFVSNGKKIFNEETVEGIMRLRQLTDKAQQASVVRQTGGLDIQSPQTAMTSAVNHAITWVFGVLNPTAARLRTITGSYIKSRNATETARQAADAILSNPEEFSKIVKELQETGSNSLTDGQKRTMFRILVQSGISGLRPEDEDAHVQSELDAETQGVLSPTSGEVMQSQTPFKEGKIYPVQPKGELSVPERTLRGTIGNAAYDLAKATGASSTMANQIRGGADVATDFVPLVGGAKGMEDAKQAFKRGEYGSAALSTAGAILGEVPGGDLAAGASKAIFGGLMARNADKVGLDLAKNMESAGKDRELILESAGWHKAADGKWRFEINDHKAKIKKAPKSGKLHQLLDHPDLFKAYPDLQDIEYQIGDPEALGMPAGARAAFMPADNNFDESIFISSDSPDIKGSLLHELQHAIQQREGFAPGSNPNIAKVIKAGTVEHEYFTDLVKAISSPTPITKEEFELLNMDNLGPYDDYVNMVKSGVNKDPNSVKAAAEILTLQHMYNREAGEVEARNTSRRQNLNGLERNWSFPPWETEDVPFDEQIVSPPLDRPKWWPPVPITQSDAPKKGFMNPPQKMKDYRKDWRGRIGKYDPEFFDESIDLLKNDDNKAIAYRKKLEPKEGKVTNNAKEVVKTGNDIIHRGMSKKEFLNILKNQNIKSKGEGNFDFQKGTTMFSPDPEIAQMYSNDFAMPKYKPTLGEEPYIVSIKRPDSSRIFDQSHISSSSEVPVKGDIGVDEITAVYRGRIVEHTPGERRSKGKKGFEQNPNSRIFWEEIPLEELFPERKK